jgi:hypothetical protein
MNNKETIIALIYDFDKTLCTKDMQEYTFLPNLGINPKDFWEDVDKLAIENNMDKILSCLYMMIKKSNESGKIIKREDFNKYGKEIEFFKGIDTWFTRINEYGKKLNVKIEHYIISSGQKEIIEGTKISKYFKEIFASEFLYEDGKAVWPAMSVNYTAKTQFLARINKGVLDISDDITLNTRMLAEDRRISTKNMIYIGDGITDIPSMRMTHENGGYSIAVYQENKNEVAKKLLKDNRVDFAVLADYQENSQLDNLIKTIIEKMTINTKLYKEHKNQLDNNT